VKDFMLGLAWGLAALVALTAFMDWVLR